MAEVTLVRIQAVAESPKLRAKWQAVHVFTRVTKANEISGLAKPIKKQYNSIGGSVVEFSPATREARVRFPADAVFPFQLLMGWNFNI